MASGTPAYMLNVASDLEVNLTPLIKAYYDDGADTPMYVVEDVRRALMFQSPASTDKTFVVCGDGGGV